MGLCEREVTMVLTIITGRVLEYPAKGSILFAADTRFIITSGTAGNHFVIVREDSESSFPSVKSMLAAMTFVL